MPTTTNIQFGDNLDVVDLGGGAIRVNGAGPGSPLDLMYLGAYAPGSYTDGQVVVYNGVAYLCVRPTTAAPAGWPIPPASMTSTQPGCRLTNSASQALPASTITFLTFDTERFDTDNMHSPTVNTGRITIQTAGVYMVGCGMEITPGTGCTRLICGIRLNRGLAGADVMRNDWQLTTGAYGGVTMNPVGLWKFNAGDYIEVYTYQASGGAGTVNASGGAQGITYTPEFFAQRMGA